MLKNAIRRLLTHRKVRFVAVGLCNAVISFGVLNLAFYVFGQPKITSSIIATTCALVFSFVMNRGFVFADKTNKIHHQFIAFTLVTISGSLLVLNVVYIISLGLLSGNEGLFITPVKMLTGISLPASFIDINVGTVIGAVAALFWNYTGYKLFVFKGAKDAVDEEAKAAV